MDQAKKESYTEPVLIAHELLRDITGTISGRCIQKSGSECAD